MHNYDITKIELISPKATAFSERHSVAQLNNSISLAKLIEGVELFYEKGKLLSEAMR